MIHSLWSIFNDVIAFTANVWQNIDGLVFTGVAVYLLIRLAKSVLGHDESTIKTSTDSGGNLLAMDIVSELFMG